MRVRTGEINLRGSVTLITDYFHIACNLILYQRGVYAESEFGWEKWHGMSVMMTKNPELKAYFEQILSQVERWQMECDLQKLILVFMTQKGDPVERWTFNIEKEVNDPKTDTVALTEEIEKGIQDRIQRILRQVTSSSSYLPMRQDRLSFELLVHVGRSTPIPKCWSDSDPKIIKNGMEVRLHSFSTALQNVQSSVCYKLED